MKDWKEIVKEDDRYKGFVIVKDPKPFNEMFAGQDIPYVQVHSTRVAGIEGQEFLVGFCGVFEWKSNRRGLEIIPLDGDSYSANMMVLGYEWFENEGQRSLDILVGEDW